MAEEIAEITHLCGCGNATRDAQLRMARRHKYLMQETVARAGLKAVRQTCARSPEEVLAFAEAQESHKVVMKPFLGMGGVNVTLLDYATEPREAQAKVERLFSTRPPGAGESPVLVQEFVEGEEYAVDLVARDGEIAVASVARYDRRPVGEAAFVMFSSMLVPVSPGSEAEAVAIYASEVMAALGIRNGPAHIEVKYGLRHGPVLVEANSHRFNGDRLLDRVAEQAVGYNQKQMFLDSVDGRLSAEAWRRRYPPLPAPELRAFGGQLDLHAAAAGIYAGGDEAAVAELSALSSVFELAEGPSAPRVGEWLAATRNKGTVPVKIGLLASSEEALAADYRRIFELERGMFRTS